VQLLRSQCHASRGKKRRAWAVQPQHVAKFRKLWAFEHTVSDVVEVKLLSTHASMQIRLGKNREDSAAPAMPEQASKPQKAPFLFVTHKGPSQPEVSSKLKTVQLPEACSRLYSRNFPRSYAQIEAHFDIYKTISKTRNLFKTIISHIGPVLRKKCARFLS
jgi:transposase-like protein